MKTCSYLLIIIYGTKSNSNFLYSTKIDVWQINIFHNCHIWYIEFMKIILISRFHEDVNSRWCESKQQQRENYTYVSFSRVRYNSTWSTNALRPRGLLSNDWKVSRAWKKRECNNRYRHVFGKMPRISVCYMRENAASRSKDSRHVPMMTRCARSKMIRELFAARGTRHDNEAVS